MTHLQRFCVEFGIDETAAAAALEMPGRAFRVHPWYVRAFLALGAG